MKGFRVNATSHDRSVNDASTWFPIRAGNRAGRAGSDPITSPIKAQKKLPAQLPALEKKNYRY